LLGQALDRRLHLQSWGHLLEKLGGRPALRNDELLFVLLGRLAKSDGQVVDGHIQQARQEMRALEMNESAQRRAIAAFNRGKSGNDRLRGYLRRLSAQPHAAEGVLRACWRMIWADGRAGTRERELIAQWGGGWAGGRIRCRRWRRTMSRKSDRWRTKQPPIKTPCGCWACQPPRAGADQACLSPPAQSSSSGQSRRKGATELQVREATEKTRELQGAYMLIRQRRDF
jgi:DnaJ like chaperone protein